MGSSTARWFVENHIIYVKNLGHLTTEDIRMVDKQIKALINSAGGSHKIHVIVDCCRMDATPSLRELNSMGVPTYLSEARTGWPVVVDPKSNFMLKVWSGFMANAANAKFRLVKGLNEGINFLMEADPELRDVSIPDIEQWAREPKNAH